MPGIIGSELLADDIRVAIAGYGLAGAVFHAPLITATPGLRLVSVVTANPQRQERARREYPEVRVLDDVAQLWELARDHDLVVVATANARHVDIARTALESGLDAVVEKPMAPTSVEAYALAELARARGRLLTVFHNRRWDGDLLTVRRLLARGELGAVTRFESRFERWQPVPRAQTWRMRADPAEAGGLLFDLGSHLVDQAILLFGAPSHLYAEIDTHRSDSAVDDDVFLALDHAAGVRSHLWSSAVAALPGPRFRVLGDRGAYVKHGLDVQEDQLREGMRPDAPDFGHEPQERWGRLAVGDAVGEVETERGAWTRFYRELVAAVRSGGPPPVDPEQAATVIEVLELARGAAAQRQVVPFLRSSGR
jgi:predicted dehydrogenase